MAEDTPNFGLTRVGSDESLSKNGYAALDGDRLLLDSLLHGLEYHSHDASPRLDGPTSTPSATATTTGGLLPSGTTYYYRVSFIDKWGLETSSSPEATVTTPSAVSVGTAPALNAYTTSGTLGAGQYSYVYTFETSDGGETTASSASSIRITDGTTNRIALTLPTFPATVTQANIYRSKPGQSQYFLIGDTTSTSFSDTGLSENYTITPPSTNTTASTNSITVSLEAWASSVWTGVAGWRIYRTTTSGAYADRSLVHQVVETVSETDMSLRKSWVDTGETLLAGVPKSISSTISGGSVIDLTSIQGSLPLTAVPRGARCLAFGGSVTGAAFDGTSAFPKLYLPYAIQPVAFTLSATGVSGRASDSVTVTLASTGGASSTSLAVGSDGGFYSNTWPLVSSYTTQGELATRSNSTSVLAVADSAAASGFSVELNAQNEYIEQALTLEPGTWTTTVRCRFTGSTGNDLTISIWETSGPSTAASPLASATFQAGTAASTTTYSTVSPTLSLTTSIAKSYTVRINKGTTSSTTNLIDWFTIAAAVPTLPAGQLSVSYTPPATGSMGTFHQYTLWF